MRALYIHIPFCEHICSYCDFCKYFYLEKQVDMYLEDLFRLFFKPVVLKGHILAIESMASLLALIHDFGAFCRYNLVDISLLSCGIHLQPTENLVCGGKRCYCQCLCN